MSSAGTLHALQSDLLSLENSLPSDLKLSQERLRLKAHSRDVGVYVALHMLWNQCHCDLYRFLVPGMREAVRSDIFKDTPAEYIAHCQMACLLAAIRATNLLADLYRLGFRKACNIPNLAVGIHQVTQILYRLQHLLQPPNSSPHGVDTIKTSLTDARSMVSILQPSARLGTKVVEILAETDALIQELGNDAPLSQDLESSGPRTILDTAQPGAGHDPWPGSAQHPASKGSFLDDIERQTNTAGQMATTVEGPAADTTSCYNTEGRTSNNTSPQDAPGYISEDRASQERQAGESLMSLQYGMANPPPGLMAGNMDPWASTDRLLDQRRPTEGNIPWDPFEVQLYDYYDAGLEMVLFSLSAA